MEFHSSMEFLSLAGAMLLAGASGGVLAGLLGVGGGIVIVPAVEAALGFLDVDPSARMHVAVATSLATIIPTSLSSARAHRRRNAIDVDVVRSWSPLILVGAVAGTVVAAHVAGRVLAAVFAVVAAAVAINMMRPDPERNLRDALLGGFGGASIPLGIGCVSTLMGIGGGSMSVPALTLMGRPIHRAVGTSALLGLVIALPASIGYVIAGWGRSDLPFGNFGYVNLVGFAVIAPATVICAPLGARLAHALPRRQLSVLFGLFLFIVAVRMAYRAYA